MFYDIILWTLGLLLLFSTWLIMTKHGNYIYLLLVVYKYVFFNLVISMIYD